MKTYEKIYQLLSEQADYLSGEELARQLGISRTAVWKAIQQLEKQGLDIVAFQHQGYKIVKGDLLLPEWLENQLGFPVHMKKNSSSTQVDAKEGVEKGEVAPALYLAPGQETARGRFGRAFFTSPGGIYMSMRLSPQVVYSDIKPYTVLVAAAIVKAIEKLTGKQAQIKWVNDIYLGDKKIAGVLTEAISSVETQTVTDVIIGVGINFQIEEFPEELKAKATSLFGQEASITRNQLIAEIWRTFFETDEQELIRFYKEKSLVLGRQVTFVENKVEYSGIASELTDDGKLLVSLTDGTQKTLSSGEISLSSW